MPQHHNLLLLSLLVKAYNNCIRDYYYFPEVIYIGIQKLDRQHFQLLLTEGYIVAYKYDSFGRYYALSKKGEQMLYECIVHKHGPRKKKVPLQVPLQSPYYQPVLW